jgi:hypothetical protein
MASFDSQPVRPRLRYSLQSEFECVHTGTAKTDRCQRMGPLFYANVILWSIILTIIAYFLPSGGLYRVYEPLNDPVLVFYVICAQVKKSFSRGQTLICDYKLNNFIFFDNHKSRFDLLFTIHNRYNQGFGGPRRMRFRLLMQAMQSHPGVKG